MSPAEESISNMKDAHRLFLQRFMAYRVMSDHDAKRLYLEVIAIMNGNTDYNDDDDVGVARVDERQFQKFLGVIGAALRDAFDFDLRTIILPMDSIGEKSSSSNTTATTTTRFHAFINRAADTPAKLYGSPNKNPHEISFFRLILEHIIDDGNSKTTGTSSGRRTQTSTAGSGCQGSLTDIEIINLRNELKGPHANKMNSHDVEHALEKFVKEQWLLEQTVTDDDDDDDNNDDDDDEEEEHRRRSSSGKKRRRNNNSEVRYFIGPRTYMELESVLKDLGLSDMPQFILYSAGR